MGSILALFFPLTSPHLYPPPKWGRKKRDDGRGEE